MKRLHLPSPQAWRDWLISLTIRPNLHITRRSAKRYVPVILSLAVIALTSVFGSKFYDEPKLVTGTRAPTTIRAPQRKTFVDQIQTDLKREQVRRTAAVQYREKPGTTQSIQTQLTDVLTEASTLRQLGGPLPYWPTGQLSLAVQTELRAMSSRDLQSLVDLLRRTTLPSSQPPTLLLSEQAWTQIQRLKTSNRLSAEAALTAIQQAHRQYQTATNTPSSYLDPKAKRRVLNLTNEDWSKVKPSFRLALRRILTQGIPPGWPNQNLTETINANLDQTSPPVRALGESILGPLLKPNLEADPVTTQIKLDQLVASVEEVKVTVQPNEVIVRKHAVITPKQFQTLEQYGLSQRGINWEGLGITLAGVLVAIALFHSVHRRLNRPLSHRDYLLLILLSASSPLVVSLSQLEFTSLPAVGLLVGSFYGSVLGGTTVVLIAAVTALGLDTGFAQLLAIAIGSFVGSVLARQPRSREELALLGLIVAILQGFLYFIFLSILGGLGYGLLGAAVRQGILGLIWSIAALGMSPYLENLFDLVTPIRLAELANPNRPLLKRLAMETPGTFQHTLFVATLAEAGARALGCNVELVRTGTLYHDIGKMHRPEAFIENQFGCENLHEALDDPWQSADIIKKHVSEGLVMARKYRLPSAVTAFIPEHQGTILVAYFYHQAQQRLDPDLTVLESDFRYDGPIPQSRETGIVMLADACEAALRSLKDQQPDLAHRTVNKIFKARWTDQQLSQSSLTRDDLKVLEQVFVEVWLQFHHQRIPYPSRLSTGI
ncbi:HD family phosphohydrolase [Lyngbya confervoides]|uniref:HDIG domain-containing protein n=1 Tax=Lyngbya confervoides BDU141951 TaxID=1574623 RepID=A0ABD4T403_9CYAN|nr:HDIG domain-containing metalloprotein [Lyngbya confervoides]MCM1983173.1 HDIG domain-containing protein [Lyngbya confervoides BDU141951]